MPSLTVSEKEHWKERISRRLDQKIEAIVAATPDLLDRVEAQARQQALRSLGLADLQAELDTIESQEEELNRREQQAHRAMLAAVRRVPVEEVTENLYHQTVHPEVSRAIARRQAVHAEELLAKDECGQQIVRLRREKDNLLDTVWLATSPIQLKQLWQHVAQLLGEEPTPLQRQALALGDSGAAQAA